MVYMENRRNGTLQATGFLLVRVDDTRPQMVAVACVISTMCISNLEFQLVNPTTQVALFSECLGTCSTLMSITWNVYQGLNSSSATTKWTPFSQHNHTWFFGRRIVSSSFIISLFIGAGRNTTNFTATNQLFLENSHVRYWRFEVVYSFTVESSSSALNFVINQPPSNGSCSISPLQGTTSTLFAVSCPGWFDEDGIKDYALSGRSAGADEQLMLAFGSSSDFTIRLPSGGDNQTQLNLLVTIRDTLDCVVSVNLSAVNVTVDVSSINQLVDQLSSPTTFSTSSPLVQLLSGGNQNTVAQLVASLSQHFNQIDGKNIDNAVSSIDNIP